LLFSTPAAALSVPPPHSKFNCCSSTHHDLHLRLLPSSSATSHSVHNLPPTPPPQMVRDELYAYLSRNNNTLQPYFNPDLTSEPNCWRVIGASARPCGTHARLRLSPPHVAHAPPVSTWYRPQVLECRAPRDPQRLSENHGTLLQGPPPHQRLLQPASSRCGGVSVALVSISPSVEPAPSC
jgi:hypothetical protein